LENSYLIFRARQAVGREIGAKYALPIVDAGNQADETVAKVSGQKLEIVLKQILL
jgi:hypothetical protein